MFVQVTLYLLELANGKFYVGQSDWVAFRIADHQRGSGSKWTQLHQTVRLCLSKMIEVEDARQAILYENWMTLHFMEKFGWKNVRGGDFLDVENYRVAEKIKHIFDLSANKIRYYIENCAYLFGTSPNWLIYVLELADGFYYVGSGKRLGKALGGHFNGLTISFTRQHPPLRVAELLIVDAPNVSYLNVKASLRQKYIFLAGKDKVIGGHERAA